ncbi:MAG TPA: isoamylase [Rhabdochlamydiaceae bacterium]|jgi:isoamylase/glycogen operon protein
MNITPGRPLPLGVSLHQDVWNFALFSRHSTKVTLFLFEKGAKAPFFEHALDPEANRTGWTWHLAIRGIWQKEVEYAYKIEGSNEDPKNRFRPDILLSDPYAKGLNTPLQWGAPRNFPEHPPRGKLILDAPFDWEGIQSPCIPMEEMIIYEMHVRCFTQHSSSKVKHPGSFLGVVEKIPYLKNLGVNALELMPIFEFNECENPHKNPKTSEALKNLWGYSTINFFSPMNRYAVTDSWTGALDDFRALVKELHKNGIEVILDVVYNHTAEGPREGPYYSFRGIDNQVYYILDPTGGYLNFSGTGNTVNANNPTVSRLIVDSLRYWVTEMHVDGFRFDLASCLTRDDSGNPLLSPPLIHLITHDKDLSHIKLIAEAWDAGGLFQVGSFPGEDKWGEWNGKYRDSARRFLKGTDGYSGAFASALCGSEDLYGKTFKPYHGINFITAHDGFTLRDLVSYQEKHNAENGEGNRDGNDQNDSWNCGIEGLTKDPSILKLREQQMKNMHTALLLSIGTPMVLMGDEYGHTRLGNNNAYPQDNALSWFLWDEEKKNVSFNRFYRLVILFRKQHALFQRKKFLAAKDIDWHSQKPLHPNWQEDSRFIAYTLKDHVSKEHIYIAFNAHFQSTLIALPDPPQNKKWRRIIDTSLESPHDFIENPLAHPAFPPTYEMPAYSAFVAKAL